MAYWLGRRIQDRNEDFEREFDSRWWILFRKFEILSKSYTITGVIIYRCYPVTPSRQQPKYALGASGPLAMGTNYTTTKKPIPLTMCLTSSLNQVHFERVFVAI